VLAFARARLDGVRRACVELGLAGPQVLTVPLTVPAAAEAVLAWRRAAPPVTGICAYNDEVALAVLAGARREGLAVPGDLAVIGIDDIPAAAVAAPALTTVRPDVQGLAGYLADTIVRKLAGRPAPRRPGADLHSVVRRASA